MPLEPLVQVTHCPTSTCLGVFGWIRSCKLLHTLWADRFKPRAFFSLRERQSRFLFGALFSFCNRSFSSLSAPIVWGYFSQALTRSRARVPSFTAFTHFSKLATRERLNSFDSSFGVEMRAISMETAWTS